MARYPEHQRLYDAFQQFIERCVLGDRSLIWPNEEVWTSENVAEIKRRMVDAPVFGGELSFEEKLEQQMRGASRQHWRLLCDVYYVYFLPSTFITFEKRQHAMHWAAQQGGLVLPPDDAEIWEAQRGGFTRTSLRYHFKYAQFWLIILFAHRLKERPDPETVARTPQEMQKILDEILEGIPSKNDRAYDMRHAMLYMAFPDHYERIISTRDKQRIVEAYRERLGGLVPTDMDEAIRSIREALSKEYDKPDRPFDFYWDLKAQWRPKSETSMDDEHISTKTEVIREGKTHFVVEPGILEDEDVSAVLTVLSRTHNAILYGPPGTGKTYIAKKAAEAFVEPQTRQPLSEPALIQRAIEGLTSYEVLALSVYLSGSQKSYSVPEIQRQPIVQARYRTSPVKYPQQNLWARLQERTSPDSETVKVAVRREPYLFDKDSQGRWFLTVAGREYVEQSLPEQLSTLRSRTIARSTDEFIMWSTFHQSYAYEDFVEGLRPIQSDESPGDVSYEIIPGVFRRICAHALEDPANKYVLVIDEINRGNIAKILGELITLIEDDKRSGGRNALPVILPYSGDTFEVPNNLYIIGTMNTADRSIALLDMALRRRFAFVELMPRPGLLEGASVETEEAVVPLAALLHSLNRGIRRYLDRDHQIGHSYFLTVADADEGERVDVLEFVWNNQILPLLEEYFYSQRDKLAELLTPFYTDVESEGEPDHIDGMDFEIGRQTGDDLIAALAKLAEKGGQP
jgi:MoxR-like ATPase